MPVALVDKDMKKLIVQLVSCGDDAKQHLSTLKSIKRSINTKQVENEDASCLINQLKADILSEDGEIVLEALSILNDIINPEGKLSDKLTVDQQISLLENLLEILAKSKQENILKQSLSLLHNQKFNESVVELFVDSILTATSTPQAHLEKDTITVINRLLEQCPKEMEENIVIWMKTLVQLSSHDDKDTREMSVSLLKENITTLVKHRKTFLQECTTILKQDVFPNLKQLASDENTLKEILNVLLPTYLDIVGENFKKSSSLLNLLLQFVEKGFRHQQDEIKCCAFNAWGCFIDTFATNKELLSSAKYVKLFTQPLKLKLKSQELVKVRLKTLWKLVVCLEEKLLDLFEVVCKPLIQMCLHNEQTSINARRVSSRFSQDLLQNHNQPDEDLQEFGIEILAHLLLDVSKFNFAFKLKPLYCPLLSQATNFLRFQSFLMPCICDFICTASNKIPDDFLSGFWSVIVNVAQDCINRKRDADFFRSLYQSISQIVTSSNLKPESLLMFVSSLSKFPRKVLNSSLLYTSDKKHSGVMHGTVNLALLDLLLTPNITKDCIGHQQFLECGQSIILCGMERDLAILEFVHAVARHLSCDHLVYLKLWNFLTEQLVQYIDKTGDINQGDSLEHDFSALYDIVLFPIEFITKQNCGMEDMTDKTIKSWQDLSEKFLSLSSNVETATPQEARIFIISNFLNQLVDAKDMVLHECTSKFFEAFSVSLIKNAVFLPKPVENKRKSLTTMPSLMDFNSLVVKMLFELSVLESPQETSSIIVNVMPALHCLFSFLPLEQVTEFFISFSLMLQTILHQDSLLMKSHESDVEDCWKQITARLPYSSKLLDEESTIEVFSIAFQDSTTSIYRSTMEFWEMKVMENFNPSGFSSDFLLLLSTVYKKNGLKVTWDDETEKPDGNFNVSASSMQSSFDDGDVDDNEDDEADDDGVVEESMVADVTSTSHQVEECDVTNDSDDITQLSSESAETSQLSSDISVEETNKSLKLRSLANSSSKHPESQKRKKTSSSPKRRRSARLRNIHPESEQLPPRKISRKSKSRDVSEEVVVLDDSDASQDERFVSACDITSTDTDGNEDEVIDVDASVYEVVNDAETSVHEEEQDDVDEGEESVESDDTEIDKSSIDKSVYEVVEMTDMSMISEKQQVESSSEDDAADAEKSVYEEVEVADSSINHEESTSSPDGAEESIYEVVEMAEMSVNQTRPLVEEEEDVDDVVEKSIYEMVEVAEVSIHPEPCETTNLEESNIQDNSTDEDGAEKMQDDVFVPGGDASIYEEVHMAEMSMNTTTRQDECDDEDEQAPGGEMQEDEHRETISDDEMKEVEKELGVQPLDNSFDGDEVPSSPEKPSNDEEDISSEVANESPLAEEVGVAIVTPNIKDFETQPKKKKKSAEETETPLRRSLRKRVSTPKVASNKREKEATRGRRTRQRLMEKADVLKTQPEENSPEKSETSDSSQKTKDSISGNLTPVVVIEREMDEKSEQEQTPNVTETDEVVAETPEVTEEENKSDKKTPTEQQKTIVAETPMVTEESGASAQSKVTATTQGCSSPSTTGQETEYVSTPRSFTANRLATLREEAVLTPSTSSPGGGILKRRISEVPSPANKSRRVSFAEPISVSKVQEEMIPSSPTSSPHSEWRKNKLANRIVSRRLSLPAPKRTVIAPRVDDVTRSPMSVRSATVAAAIAGIKARGDNSAQAQQSSPTSSLQASSRDPVSPSKSIARVNQLTVAQLANQSLLQSLSVNQLSHLADCVLQAGPVVHSIFKQKIGKT